MLSGDTALSRGSPAPRRADALSARERVAIYAVMLLASLAYNYSFIILDYVRPFLVRSAGMTLAETALLYSAQAAGVLAGSALIPVAIARTNARLVLFLATVSLAAATVGNLFIAAVPAWLVLRFVVGVTLAGCYVASMTILANLFPARTRGRLLSANMAMFSVALLAMGGLGASLGEAGFRILFAIGAALPALAALLTLLFVPDDRQLVVFGNGDGADMDNRETGRWAEMLRGPLLRLTLACTLLAGLNFSAYQFYSGFITTYLLEVRHLEPRLIGLFVSVDGLGTLVGTALWGLVADRYGRRVNLAGFPLAALCIGAILLLPTRVPLLVAVEFCYAVGLSCTNCWAAYFAELFPVRLRPMGTALFHGGHVISLFAPLVVATVSRGAPLAVGMALAPVSFLIAALLWARLPETLTGGLFYRGFDPEAAAQPPVMAASAP